jgi:hypothetical protein
MTARRVFALFFALVLLPVTALLACSTLTPAEKAHVAADSVAIDACVAGALLCKAASDPPGYSKCRAEYEGCMRAHGYRDAGNVPDASAVIRELLEIVGPFDAGQSTCSASSCPLPPRPPVDASPEASPDFPDADVDASEGGAS